MGTTKTELHRLFNLWADQNTGSRMGRNKVSARLTCIDGVVDVRITPSGARALNVVRRKDDDQGAKIAGSSGSSSAPYYPTRARTPEEPEGGGSRNAENNVEKECVRTAGTAGDLGPAAWADLGRTPVEHVLEGISEPDRRCKWCGGPESLVPPGRFWYACAACHPVTFERG